MDDVRLTRRALFTTLIAGPLAGTTAAATASFAWTPRLAQAQGANAQLDALLARFRAVPGFRARFHETKSVALLRRPIESEGTLHFAPPSRFARHLVSPTRSSIVVDGRTVIIASREERRELPIAQTGAARPFLEGFIALLAGDRAALERSFRCRFVDGTPWELELVPTSRGPIARVVVHGRGVVLEDYRLVETSGDTTVARLVDVDVTHAYDAREARRVFRPLP